MIKTVLARHVGPGLRCEIETGTGHRLVVDDERGNDGPRPAEILLAALAGCTAFDVASILAKKRQSFSSYRVSVCGEQRDEPHPHVFERIEIVHELEGAGLEASALRRAIELSATRYCTATAMLSAGPAEIHHRYRIRDEDRPMEAEEVVVTGPGASYDSARTQAAVVPLGGGPPEVVTCGPRQRDFPLSKRVHE